MLIQLVLYIYQRSTLIFIPLYTYLQLIKEKAVELKIPRKKL